MNKITNQFTSIEQVTERYLNKRNSEKVSKKGLSFEEILNQKREASESSELKFSKHAVMRLENRKINLSREQSQRLENGVQKASEKGIKESLVLVDTLAFIVNVPNKIVFISLAHRIPRALRSSSSPPSASSPLRRDLMILISVATVWLAAVLVLLYSPIAGWV